MPLLMIRLHLVFLLPIQSATWKAMKFLLLSLPIPSMGQSSESESLLPLKCSNHMLLPNFSLLCMHLNVPPFLSICR
jgi:hypothetical protein